MNVLARKTGALQNSRPVLFLRFSLHLDISPLNA